MLRVHLHPAIAFALCWPWDNGHKQLCDTCAYGQKAHGQPIALSLAHACGAIKMDNVLVFSLAANWCIYYIYSTSYMHMYMASIYVHDYMYCYLKYWTIRLMYDTYITYGWDYSTVYAWVQPRASISFLARVYLCTCTCTCSSMLAPGRMSAYAVLQEAIYRWKNCEQQRL